MINARLSTIYWKKNNSVSIHHKHLQALAIEMFKVHTKTSPEILQEFFLVKEQGKFLKSSRFSNFSG